MSKRKPNYIDRTSPRFGDGWVEFPIVSYETGRIVRTHKETIVVKTLAYVEAEPDSQEAIEETRKHYLSTIKPVAPTKNRFGRNA